MIEVVNQLESRCQVLMDINQVGTRPTFLNLQVNIVVSDRVKRVPIGVRLTIHLRIYRIQQIIWKTKMLDFKHLNRDFNFSFNQIPTN